MDSRVEIRHLRAFVAVVEAGSFTAGARSLNVSQPALSQNVALLEQSLNRHLLDRGPCGVSPTPAGTALYGEARILIKRFERALAMMASFSPEAHAVLRIAVPTEMAVQPLTAALAKLAASPFKSTSVQISQLPCPEQLRALQKGALDLALITEHPPEDGFDTALVAEEPLGVLVAAEQMRGVNLHSSHLRLDELAGLEWLGFPRSESPTWYDHVVAVLRNHGIEVSTCASEATELAPAVRLAQLSMGGRFALGPREHAQECPQTLIWLPLAGEPLIRRTWTVWPAWSTRRDLGLLVAAMETNFKSAVGHLSSDIT